jgi:ribosomal protein S18 acetylase RimI-like enzyme
VLLANCATTFTGVNLDLRRYDYGVKEQSLGSDVLLRGANLADLPELLRVCLETGDSGKDATHLHNLPELVGDIYVAPYVLHEPQFAYVLLAENQVVGYLLGVLDTRTFEKELSAKYWSAAKAKYQHLTVEITPSDQELLNELGKQGFSNNELTAKFPSHLHIDIVESHQGAGYGKAMIAFLLAELKAAGSTGVHLHMSATNDRARAFYKKFGFAEVSEDSNECIMGLTF